MKFTTLMLAGALALGVSYAPPRVEVAAVHAAGDTPADWDKQYERTLDNAVKELDKLAKWCDKNHLEWTGNYVRRKAFHYRPNDEEKRAYFGYDKWPDGRWRQNDIKRDEFRSIIDEDDPRSGKFPSNMDKANGRIAGWFRGLAQKALSAAEDAAKSDDPAVKATAGEWQDMAARAWREVLATDPDGKYANTAHKALDHPKFDGEYVSPFKLKFLEARKSRKQAGEALAAKTYDIQQVPADGEMASSGLTAVGTKSANWLLNTTHTQEVCDRLTLWAERATEDIIERYGLPDQVKQRFGLRKFDIVKQENNREELRQYLLKGANWDQAKVTKYLERFSGMGSGAGTYVTANSSNADADDSVIHRAGHVIAFAARGMAAADLGNRLGSSGSQGVEDWLQESVAYDCTRRLTGTTLTTCGEFGKYGMNVTAKPGQDLWIQLARRQVEMDDDVPINELWRKSINDLRGPETVKGYALIQFLFEQDAAMAQKFIWHSLAHGTPAAAVDVYGDWLGTPKPKDEDATAETYAKGAFNQPEYQAAMDALDDRYKEWILGAW